MLVVVLVVVLLVVLVAAVVLAPAPAPFPFKSGVSGVAPGKKVVGIVGIAIETEMPRPVCISLGIVGPSQPLGAVDTVVVLV